MRIHSVVAALLIAGCARTTTPEPAPAEADEPPLPLDPAVRTGTLDNGLTWFVEPNPWPEDRAELRLVVKAGSVLEEEDQLGAAHFVEHMAFNGTEHFEGTALVRFLESMGARFGPDINAYTSFDETVYMLHVPTDDPELLDQAFLVLSDWAGGVSFDEEEFERERGVIIEEWRTGRGAGGRTVDATLPIVFHGSRYAERVPIGSDVALQGMTREALVRFYETWYRPDLMAVVAVGDFDPEQVEDLVEEHFSDLSPPEDAPERPTFDIPPHEDTLALVQRDPEITQPTVQVMQKIDWAWGDTASAYRAVRVEDLFYDMLNARFAQVAARPDAPFVAAGAGRQLQTPTRSFRALSGRPREGRLVEGLEAMLGEVGRVQQHGFTEAELERAKQNAMRMMENWLQEQERTPSSLAAAEIVRHVLHGEPMPGTAGEYELFTSQLPTITLDEVNRVADTFLAGDSLVVLASVPETDANVPTARELVSLVDDFGERAVEAWVEEAVDGELIAERPQPGEIVERDTIEEIGVTEWRLSNGARVLVKPTDFEEDAVRFGAYSWGGTSTAPDEAFFSATVADAVVARSGLGPFDRIELEKYLAGTEAGVSPWIAEVSEGLSGSASPQDLELALQLVHLAFVAPRFDREAFEVELRDRAERLRNRALDPASAFEDALDEVVWNDHLRRRAWTVEDLENIELDEIEAFYRERFADAGDFTFVFVGNVTPEALEGPVEAWIGSLPARPGEDTWRDVGAREQPGPVRRVVQAGIEDQAVVHIQMHGPAAFGLEEAHELATLAEILQVRLREELREELGGTYGAQVSARMWPLPEPGYRLIVQFQTEPDRVEEMEQAVFDVMEELRTEPVASRYLENWRTQQRRALETQMQENPAWIGWISEYDQAGWPLAEIADADELIAGDDPERVREAARRWLHPDRAVEIILVPEGPTGRR